MPSRNASPRRAARSLLGALAALLLLAAAATSACSSTSSHEILSFFFDGVPDPAAPDPLPVVGPQLPAVSSLPVPQPHLMAVHRPYAEGRCEKCHASRAGKPAGVGAIFQGIPMLLKPIEELCFTCHSIAQKKNLHAPAISGQCTFCHDPHQTPNRRMLLMQSTRELCARCHKGSTFLTEKDHGRYGERECIDCHDPHAADLDFNLLPGARDGRPEVRQPTVSLPQQW